MTKDLWPSDFSIKQLPENTLPVRLVQDQAALLETKTDGTVLAEVLPSDLQDGLFRFHFFLLAPALGIYRYRLFTFEYDIELFPVKFMVDEDIGRELVEMGLQAYRDDGLTLMMQERVNRKNWGALFKEALPTVFAAGSEEELDKLLQAILGSKKTRRIINTLIEQSKLLQ